MTAGRWLRGKALVAVLIGLVSLTTAVLTWRALVLGGMATDNDRGAVLETVRQQRLDTRVALHLENDRATFASIRESLEGASGLEAQAAELRGRGERARASVLDDQANLMSLAARDLARLNFLDLSAAAQLDARPPSFDLDTRRRELERQYAGVESQGRPQPDQAADRADRFRERSQRLVGHLIVLVATVVLLTGAQVTKRARLRPWLAGLATSVWLGTTAVAVAGAGA